MANQNTINNSTNQVKEYNFDGLTGPTHNYAGLSVGNKASMSNKNKISSPKKAALEGLEKMKFLMDLGFPQALLPPVLRPDFSFLKKLQEHLTSPKKKSNYNFYKFNQSEKTKLIHTIYQFSPELLSTCYSSGSMWSANSATCSPSADTRDHKVHFTLANLHSHLHRSIEVPQSVYLFKKIFSGRHFVCHLPLPSHPYFADEGAANHMRFCSSYGKKGVEVFVYGRKSFFSTQNTQIFIPRQTQLATQIIAHSHKLSSKNTIMVQQNPKVIDAGAFHNDVVCVNDQNLLFFHEQSFVHTKKFLTELKQKLNPTPLITICVHNREISLKDSISSYLFNSQLLPLKSKKSEWMLIAPLECQKFPKVKNYLKHLPLVSPIKKVYFVSVRQSMKNGGGPACLRIRVVLTPQQAQNVHQGVILTPLLYKKIKKWIHKHYRDQLKPKDLLDPLLVKESQFALDELSNILKLPDIYSFQNPSGLDF